MEEKLQFSKWRSNMLSTNKRLLELEQWGKYCYLPLDIPKIESPKLVNWFFENKEPIVKLSPDIASPQVYNKELGIKKSLYDAIDVFPLGNTFSNTWSTNDHPEFLTLFPEIYDQLMTGFPLKSVGKIRFWSSKMPVIFHRDESVFLDYPSSFRVMLHDENPAPTLSLIDVLPDTTTNFDNKFPLHRLEETNTFAWNNLRTKHGSSFQESYKKVLIILERCEIDIPKFHSLMERSVEKYKDFTMISNNKITDYVNL